MKTISLKLPEALDMKLTALIRRQGGSKSAIVRAALEAYIARESEAAQGSVLEAAQDLCGCLEGPADLSTNPNRLDGYGQ